MFNSFKIIENISVFYRLKLFLNMHQYDIFSFNYLRLVVNDLLSNGKKKSSKLIIVDDKKV